MMHTYSNEIYNCTYTEVNIPRYHQIMFAKHILSVNGECTPYTTNCKCYLLHSPQHIDHAYVGTTNCNLSKSLKIDLAHYVLRLYKDYISNEELLEWLL